MLEQGRSSRVGENLGIFRESLRPSEGGNEKFSPLAAQLYQKNCFSRARAKNSKFLQLFRIKQLDSYAFYLFLYI